MLFMTTLLVCCNRSEDLDDSSIEAIFENLEIDTDAVMANRISYEEDGSFDQMEMYDATDRDEIVFHFITSSDNAFDRRDEMIMITPDFIYRTQTMKRYANDLDPHDDDDFRRLIERYCTLIDLDDLSLSNLSLVALGLEDPIGFKENRHHVLRGMIPDSEPPDNMVDVVEFEYDENRLLELRYRREYDRRSTKQQSNFVSGTHYVFMNELFADFPDLDQFDDA